VPTRIIRRCGLSLAVLIAGCALPGSRSDLETTPSVSHPEPVATPAQNDACNRDRRGCMYEGPYEQGERQYAEEEARRLNRAELKRLRSQW